MQVQVNVKRIGKRRNAIETRPYEIGAVRSIGGLIAAFVTAEVTRCNQRAAAGETALAYLTSEEIADAATVGKVGFGADYNGKVQDTTAAIANAHECFIDGIYRIFVNGAEVEGALNSPVTPNGNPETHGQTHTSVPATTNPPEAPNATPGVSVPPYDP